MKEYSWPHWGQNPSVRPGTPSRLRPIALPHLEQLRLDSGTSGWGLIAFDGSTGGAGGTLVRPAPIRAARSRCEPERARRVAREPAAARSEPKAADCTRLAEVATDTSSPTAATEPCGPPAPVAAPVDAAAAMPQVLQ